jgi:dihydroxyacid dehydratase/phosphogluconate dehydratase
MDAKTKLKSRLPSRHVTEGPERATAVTDGIAMEYEGRKSFARVDMAEVFKRTPNVADLKPGGRDVAKEMFEAGAVPLLLKTLPDHALLHDCMIMTGLTVAQNLKSVNFNSCYLWKYTQQVGPALNGAVTHPGGAAETSCYADI